MGKIINDTVYDQTLEYIQANAESLYLVAGAVSSLDDVTSQSLGFVSVASADFTIAAGDVSGRKITVAAKTGFSISQTSTLDHVVLVTSAAILFATTHAATSVTSGETRNSNAFKMELRDPT